jgi:hypothetical protein
MTDVLEFALIVHRDAFIYMAVIVAASMTMALFFALVIQVLNGEHRL